MKKKTLLYYIVYFLLRLFTPKYKIEGLENIPNNPVIMIGNHCQMYGPLACVFYFKTKCQIWCIGQMMDKKEVAGYTYQDFWSHKPKAFKWFYKLLSHILGGLFVYIFTRTNLIPVYHDARLLNTFKTSLRYLKDGTSIVIFPEKPKLYNNIINDFQEKFIDLANYYYKQNGKDVDFVPFYISPKKRKIVIGKKVTFNHEQDINLERTRIISYLKENITDLAYSMPKHKVVPYLNVAGKYYQYNQPIKYFTEENNPFIKH